MFDQLSLTYQNYSQLKHLLYLQSHNNFIIYNCVMLSLRLSKICFFCKNLVPSASQSQSPSEITQGEKDPYRKYRKSGPELQISKILILNGSLHHKQVWRNYQQQLYEKKKNYIEVHDYFPTLRALKETMRTMRRKGKVQSNGYDKKNKVFLGWQVNKEKCLKYVHPQIKNQIEEILRKRAEL